MKSEHRHELKTNELGQLAQRLMPFLEKHANRILIGFSVIALAAAAYIYWTRSASVTADAGWTRFIAANTAEEFENISDDFEGSTIGAWARLRAAEGHLRNGIQAAFKDREAALSDLKQARTILEGLLGEKKLPAQVREGALYLLARCLETLSDGNTDAAVDMYERLLKEFPESMYKERAQRQIAVLRTDEAKEFYAWFQRQNPKPPDIKKPKDRVSEETEEEGDEAEFQDDAFESKEDAGETKDDASETKDGTSETKDDAGETKDDAGTEKTSDSSTAQPEADGKQGPDLKPNEGEKPGKTDDSPTKQ